MTGPPGGVPPPEKETAAQAGTGAAGKSDQKQKQQQSTTTDAYSLVKKALEVVRDSELYEFLPEQPAWYRRVGDHTHRYLATQKVHRTITEESGDDGLPSLDRKRLDFVHDLAVARQRGAEIGPAYPAPTHTSIVEARKALGAVFDQFLNETLTYQAATTRMAA